MSCKELQRRGELRDSSYWIGPWHLKTERLYPGSDIHGRWMRGFEKRIVSRRSIAYERTIFIRLPLSRTLSRCPYPARKRGSQCSQPPRALPAPAATRSRWMTRSCAQDIVASYARHFIFSPHTQPPPGLAATRKYAKHLVNSTLSTDSPP